MEVEYNMQCPRCRAGVTQIFKRVRTDQVLVITKCIRKGCKWQTGFIIPLSEIHVDAPSIGWKIEHYGIVCIA